MDNLPAEKPPSVWQIFESAARGASRSRRAATIVPGAIQVKTVRTGPSPQSNRPSVDDRWTFRPARSDSSTGSVPTGSSRDPVVRGLRFGGRRFCRAPVKALMAAVLQHAGRNAVCGGTSSDSTLARRRSHRRLRPDIGWTGRSGRSAG